MAYRPLSLGGQVADLGAPEDILAQSISASAARDARRKAAQDAQKAQLDLAKQTIENQELDRTVKEDASRRGVLGGYIRNREGAMDLPIGVQSPEFMEAERPSNAPFGPMNAPAPKPNRMERNTILDLAAVNPDFAENFRKGQIGERQGIEDRTRKFASEDQKQIADSADFGLKKQKTADDLALDTRQQTEVERNNRAQNNVAWFMANTGRQNANTAATVAGNGKPPTESQANFAIYGRRLQDAEGIFDDLTAKGFDRAKLKQGALAKTAGYLGFKSPELRQQEQAERNFVNATLRRESGAAISPSEFESAEKQYFPRTSDDPQTIANKKRNREIQLQSFKGLSGNAWQKAGGDVSNSNLTPAEEAELNALLQAAGQ